MSSRRKLVLYLDDLRDVPMDTENEYYKLVRSYGEFTKWIEMYGFPDVLDLDHDLGGEKTGYDCLLYLIDCDMIVPKEMRCIRLPELRIHSANPVGRENMRILWRNYKKNR